MNRAYPLHWPDGWPRTKAREHVGNHFGSRLTIPRAFDRLRAELRRMKAGAVVISTNQPLRADGAPMGELSRAAKLDPGAAVYFTRGQSTMVLACDRWESVEGNLNSLALAIEGLRQLERHGSPQMMERAMEGFVALPPATPWRETLGLRNIAPDKITLVDVQHAYRMRAREVHEDHEAMVKLNAARDMARDELERRRQT